MCVAVLCPHYSAPLPSSGDHPGYWLAGPSPRRQCCRTTTRAGHTLQHPCTTPLMHTRFRVTKTSRSRSTRTSCGRLLRNSTSTSAAATDCAVNSAAGALLPVPCVSRAAAAASCCPGESQQEWRLRLLRQLPPPPLLLLPLVMLPLLLPLVLLLPLG